MISSSVGLFFTFNFFTLTVINADTISSTVIRAVWGLNNDSFSALVNSIDWWAFEVLSASTISKDVSSGNVAWTPNAVQISGLRFFNARLTIWSSQ